MDTNDCAVVVRDCLMSFPKPKSTVMTLCENFNLTLPRGSVYAVLGPSSCGKTSLIKAILGQKQIDGGAITIFGQEVKQGMLFKKIIPSDIGYMPQSMCLYDGLTIGETLTFFGGILGLSREVIKERIEFYIEFLKLPNKNSINCNLSGGQKRRVSFATSIIHHPKLLILDEPTEGLDPIVRQSIWKYLTDMATTKLMSILITTHFIEEARDADIVGMWHGHRLHVEASPDYILTSLNSATLEDAFFLICSNAKINDNNSSVDDNLLDLTALAPASGKISTTPDICNNRTSGVCSYRCDFSFNRTGVLIRKNVIRFVRSPGALAFLLGLPALTVVLFFFSAGQMRGIDMAVLLSDKGHLGSRYMNFFNPKTFSQTAVTSTENGLRDVMSGGRTAFVSVEEHFSEQFQSLFTNENRMLGRSNGSFHGGKINLTLDGTNFILNTHTIIHMMIHLENLCIDIANNSGLNQLLCKNFLNIVPIDNEMKFADSAMTKYLTPGLLVIACYFLTIPCTLLSFFMEKHNGYFERGYIAGIKPLETMCSFVVIVMGLMLLGIIGILIITFLVFESPLQGSLVLTFVFMLWVAINGMSMGFMVSSVSDNINHLYLMASYWLFYSIGLSGWIWPLAAMSKSMKYICYCLPFALPVEALNGIMQNGWDFLNFKVWLAFVVMTTWSLILNVITFYKIRSTSG